MEALSAAEFQIIQTMLVKQYGPDSLFLGQLAGTRVESRRMTGVGIFVDLLVGGDAGRVDDINSEISGSYMTSLRSPGDLVGFTLFIRSGYLNFLEGYTFGDVKWPEEPMEKWLKLAKPERTAVRP